MQYVHETIQTTSEQYSELPPAQRDPFSSFGKKKKKKKPPAPVPPTVPSPPPPDHAPDHTLSQSAPNVSHHLSLDLDPTYDPEGYGGSDKGHAHARLARDQPLSPIGEVTPVGDAPLAHMIPLELSESPGARRKLTARLSQNYEELEEAGVEGAPGEMAAYLTDEEVSNRYTKVIYCYYYNYYYLLQLLLLLLFITAIIIIIIYYSYYYYYYYLLQLLLLLLFITAIIIIIVIFIKIIVISATCTCSVLALNHRPRQECFLDVFYSKIELSKKIP